MKAVVVLLYPDDKEITMTIVEAEEPDNDGGTLGLLVNGIVESNLRAHLAIKLTITITRDTET